MKITIGSATMIIFTLILVTLKICGYISISWLWVFCPLWIFPAFTISITSIILGFVLAILVILTCLSPIILVGYIVYKVMEL